VGLKEEGKAGRVWRRAFIKLVFGAEKAKGRKGEKAQTGKR